MTDNPLRFVIHCHHTGPNSPPDDPNPHYDLMWEEQPGASLLRTLQLSVEPTLSALTTGIPCRELLPHRRAYIDLDRADVSRDRGYVERWDTGTVAISNHSHPLRLVLTGLKLTATLVLRDGLLQLANITE